MGIQSSDSPQDKAKTGGKAVVKSGIISRDVKAGMTVGEARKAFTSAFRLTEDSKAFCGTRQLSDDEVITDDMTVEFVKKTGEKGYLALAA